MKTFKKSIAVLLSILMLVSVMTVAGASVSAAEDTVYFVNTAPWGEVYAYAYSTAGGENAKWPGVEATVVDAEKGIFSYDVGEYDKLVFNNNNQELQTPNLDVADNFGKYYEPKTAAFYDTYEAAIEAVNGYVKADYYVIGAEGLCGNNWLLSDNSTAMTKNEDGTYTKVFENIAAGTYDFKINDGTWAESYPPGTENATVTVENDNSKVTITLSTGQIDIKVEYSEDVPSTTEPQETGDTTTPQETNPNETVPEATTAPQTTEPKETTEPMEPNSPFYVVGSVELFGTSWADGGLKPENSMTQDKNGDYYLTLTNVAAGTYTFKVVDNIKGTITWHPDGMGNDGTVTVAEDGSTVTFAYRTGELAGIVAVNETPTFPKPTDPETEPITEPETTAPVVIEGKITVNAKSNIASDKTATYDLSRDKTVTVKFDLQAANKIENCEGSLKYDSKVLRLESFEIPNLANVAYNTKLSDMVKFNSTEFQNPGDFTTAKTFVEAKFTVLAAGNTTVTLDVVELNGADGGKEVAYVTDGTKVGTFTMASNLSTPTPAPTTAAVPKLKTTSAKLKAGKTTSIKVLNVPSGAKVKYTVDKKKIATVDSKGKVTALTKGAAKVTAKVYKGTKTIKSLTFKVSVTSNPKLSKTTIKAKKGKTYSIKITGKASTVKNKYSVQKKKLVKLVTKNTKATTVKFKALKNGTSKVYVTVNGKKLSCKVVVK